MSSVDSEISSREMSVLALGYCFPPDSHPEAFVSAKVLGNIPNCNVDIITVPPEVVRSDKDHSLDQYVGGKFREVRRVENVVSRSARILPWLPIPPDRFVLLNRTVVRAANQLGEGKYDCLITRSQFHSVHLAGLALRRQWSKTPWIACFSDPLVGNPMTRWLPWRQLADRMVERVVIETADAVVFSNEETVELVMGKYPDSWRRRVFVLPHSFEPDFYLGVHDHVKLPIVIRFLGSLYQHRSPEPLFRALVKLVSDEEIDRGSVKIELVGSIEPRMMKTRAAKSLPKGMVVAKPRVNYSESLSLMSSSDLLLAIDSDLDESPFLPSKLIDYLGADRPILGIVPPGPAYRLLRNSGGFVANPGNTDEIASVLKQAIASVTDGLEDAIPESQIVSTYKSEAVGLQMRVLIDQVVAGSKILPTISISRPKSILVVIGSLERGGAEQHLLTILPRLSRDKFKLELFLLEKRGELARDMEEKGVRILNPWFSSDFTTRSRFLSAIRVMAVSVQLFFHLLMRRPAVVHFFLPESYLMTAPLAILAGIRRRVMSRRSLNIYQRKRPLFGKIERYLHHRMDFILGNSRAVLAELVGPECAPAERTGLLYNGIVVPPLPHPDQRKSVRDALGITNDALVFTVVANLIPYKGHMDLANAFGFVRDRLPSNWRILVVGRDDGVLAELIDIVTQYGLSENFVFLGPRGDVLSLLLASDIGVLASHQEGFSNSILEGMAAKLPMIVTDVGGNKEAVIHRETGLVVPPQNPGSLGDAILELAWNRDLRARMGLAGRVRVEENFSVERCVKDYERFYEVIIDGYVAGDLSGIQAGDYGFS